MTTVLDIISIPELHENILEFAIESEPKRFSYFIAMKRVSRFVYDIVLSQTGIFIRCYFGKRRMSLLHFNQKVSGIYDHSALFARYYRMLWLDRNQQLLGRLKKTNGFFTMNPPPVDINS